MYDDNVVLKGEQSIHFRQYSAICNNNIQHVNLWLNAKKINVILTAISIDRANDKLYIRGYNENLDGGDK